MIKALAPLGLMGVLILLGATVQPTSAAFPGDNGKIAFVVQDFGDRHVWTMNPDGSERTQVTFGDDADYQPSWSPDGTELVFRRNAAAFGDKGLYIVGADGQHLRKIPGTEDGFTASWSPDGGRIAFEDESRIAVIDVDGTGFIEVTGGVDGTQYSADWSPDNERIAVVNNSKAGEVDIWTINMDGTGLEQITNTPSVSEENSNWSPEGSRLVFGASER